MPRRVQRPVEPVPRYALTRAEAAASIGVSVPHFERHVLPALEVVRCGQLVLVPPAELENWVRTHAQPAGERA
jgi:hypothetical protein